MREQAFQGWWILAVTCLVVLLSNGLTLGGITVFDRSLLEALQIGRGALKFRDLVQMLTAAAAAPFLGYLADRFGVRPLILLGLVLLSIGFLGYSRVESISDIYVLHVLLGLGLSSTGLVLCVSVVSRWFNARRGLALGLVLAGASVGNGLLPLFNAALNAQIGWRNAFIVLGCLPLTLIPAVLWLVRESPASIGQKPYGELQNALSSASLAAPTTITYTQALSTRNFKLLGLIAFCSFLSLVGVTAHLFLFLKDQAFTDARAATGLTLLYALGLVGKLLAGVMADRWGLKSAFLLYLIAMTVGALLLSVASDSLPWLAIAVLGLGWGGTYTLQQLCAAELFSGAALGRIVGTLVLIDSFGAALGPWGMGYAYDRFGSYQYAFNALLALLTISVVAAMFLKLPNSSLARRNLAPT